MIKRPRYIFKKECKNEFLKGIKMNYLSDKIGISYSYLSSILQGQNVVDEYLMYDIITNIGYASKEVKLLKEKYFTLRGEK